MEVWMDPAELGMRQLNASQRMEVVMDFKSFGGTRRIQAPPASDTGDLTSEIQQQAQSQGQ
jgi:hypothetical protein